MSLHHRSLIVLAVMLGVPANLALAQGKSEQQAKANANAQFDHPDAEVPQAISTVPAAPETESADDPESGPDESKKKAATQVAIIALLFGFLVLRWSNRTSR